MALQDKTQVKVFPEDGMVRAQLIADFLGIGLSTVWYWVKIGRLKPPVRIGARTSVWDAKYIRELASGTEEISREAA